MSATLGKIEGFSDEVITLEEWMEAVVRGANNNGKAPHDSSYLISGGVAVFFFGYRIWF